MTDRDADAPAETLYEGQWLRMRHRGRWEYAERTHGNGMAVIIVAQTPEDRVLFVEQYRIPLEPASWRLRFSSSRQVAPVPPPSAGR